MFRCKDLRHNFISQITKSFLRGFFLLLILFSHSAGAMYEGARDGIKYDSINSCDTGDLKFDPFTNNVDLNWDLSNPTCAGFASGIGASLALYGKYVDFTCITSPTNTVGNPRLAQEFPLLAVKTAQPIPPTLTPTCLSRLTASLTQCGKFCQDVAISNTACIPIPPSTSPAQPYFCGGLPSAINDQVRCCNAYTAYSAIISAALVTLSLIWDSASITYKSARICGHDWQKWEEDEDGKMVRGKGNYRTCLENMFLNGESCRYKSSESTLGDAYVEIGSDPKDLVAEISNKYYREFIYGGKEFSDDECKNPWTKEERKEFLGYTGDYQRYYMTGPGAAPIYACQRFLTKARTDETMKAYSCCIQKSKNSICIENRAGLGKTLGEYKHKFCRIGSKCTVANVSFSVYESKKESNYVCASTYSVCPYDHLLGGGTEEQKYYSIESGKIGQTKNYCQFMKHCSKLPVTPYFRTSSLEGGAISSACKDLKGDAQNVYSYSVDMTPIKGRNFTAPIAQCFKETMENIFLNKAGDTLCIDSKEYPDSNGVCVSGYKYKKGEELPTEGPFAKIQRFLQFFIKACLVVSITALGYSMLLAVPGVVIERKKLLTYVLKMVLVIYFAIGSGWKDGFAKGVISASGLLSDITFKLNENKDENKLDGCQFPKVNYADSNVRTKYDNPAYSPENTYLRVWDTLDCKITMALGFTPGANVPNLILMIISGLVTGGLGAIFFLATFVFAASLIMIAIQALEMFLVSTAAIVILLYVSPLIIVSIMFERTKSIFDGWQKALLALVFQPMVLFAYLSILITVMDKALIGDDVTFKGSGKSEPKQISCNKEAQESSVYCIFKVAQIKTYNGFELFGVGLPILVGLNKAKLQTLIKAALIMVVFMSFLGMIADVSKALFGGVGNIKPDWDKGASKKMESAYNFVRGAQKRGASALWKHGLSGAKALRSGVKSIGSAIGNKGKSVAETNVADRVGASASGVDNNLSSAAAKEEVKGSGGENKDSVESQENKVVSDDQGSTDNKAADSAKND